MRTIIISVLSFLISATSLFSQNKEHTFYCLGSPYSGQTILFLNDLESNEALKSAVAQYNYTYIDVNEDQKGKPGAEYLIFVSKGVELPVLIITDSHGDIRFYQAGYQDNDKLADNIGLEQISASPVLKTHSEVIERYKTNKPNLTDMPFIHRLAYTRWKFGLELGGNLFNIANSDLYTDYKLGYEGKLYTRYRMSRGRYVDAGLGFSSIGGRESGNSVRLNYLNLPVAFSKRILRPSWAGIYMSAGLYGAYRIGGSSDFAKWDGGMNLGLSVDAGSFSLYGRYTRGFVDVMPSLSTAKCYNNGFSLGVAIRIGD